MMQMLPVSMQHHPQQPLPNPAASFQGKAPKKERRREICFLEYEPHAKKHFPSASSASKVANNAQKARASSSQQKALSRKQSAASAAAAPKQPLGSSGAPVNAASGGVYQPCPQVVQDYVSSLHMLRANLAVQQALAERQLQALVNCFGPDVLRPPPMPTMMASPMGTPQLAPLRSKPMASPGAHSTSGSDTAETLSIASPPPALSADPLATPILGDDPNSQLSFGFDLGLGMPMQSFLCMPGAGSTDDVLSGMASPASAPGTPMQTPTMSLYTAAGDATPPVSLDRGLSLASGSTASAPLTGPGSPVFDLLPLDNFGLMLSPEDMIAN